MINRSLIAKNFKRFLPLFFSLILLSSAVVYAVVSTPVTIIQGGSLASGYSYIIFRIDSTYYARNGLTGAIDYTSINASFLVLSIISSLSSTGGNIYFKNAEYKMDATLVGSDGVNFLGESPWSSASEGVKFVWEKAIVGIDFTGVRDARIEGICLDGSSVGTIAVNVGGTRTTIMNVNIYSWTDVALRFYDVNQFYGEKIYIITGNSAIESSGGYFDHSTFVSCTFLAEETNIIYGSGISFIGCDFTHTGLPTSGYGTQIVGNETTVSFTSCIFENNVAGLANYISITGCAGVSFISTRFYGSAGSSYTPTNAHVLIRDTPGIYSVKGVIFQGCDFANTGIVNIRIDEAAAGKIVGVTGIGCTFLGSIVSDVSNAVKFINCYANGTVWNYP